MQRAIVLLVLLLLNGIGPLCRSAAAQSGDVAPAPEPSTFERLGTWLEEGYAHEPALVVTLALLLVISPLVSIGALLAVSVARARERRIARLDAPLRQAMQAAEKGSAKLPPVTRRAASLQLLDGPATSLPLDGPMVRIGRHEENDIRLTSKTVHRYHALVTLTPEREYILTDLSGQDGNGVIVNGKRVEQATLRPDDVIELGEVKLRFHLGAAAAG